MKFICTGCNAETPCKLEADTEADVPEFCPWNERSGITNWKEIKKVVFEMHGACADCCNNNETCIACGTWVSVKDSVPKNGQLVLSYTPGVESGRDITEIRLLSWFPQCIATHWMPVPDAPEMHGACSYGGNERVSGKGTCDGCKDASHFDPKKSHGFVVHPQPGMSKNKLTFEDILAREACQDASPFDPKRRPAATPEPPPTGHGQYVLCEALKDVCARADAGQKKYGTMLRTHNGRDALNDAYQEAIDLFLYIKQAMLERGGK